MNMTLQSNCLHVITDCVVGKLACRWTDTTVPPAGTQFTLYIRFSTILESIIPTREEALMNIENVVCCIKIIGFNFMHKLLSFLMIGHFLTCCFTGARTGERIFNSV